VSLVCPSCSNSVVVQGALWAPCQKCRAMVFAPQAGPSVLVAHASQPVAARIGVTLAEHGLSPLHAAHGDAALRLLEGHCPQAAVLDVALGGLMSFELVDRIRKSASLSRMVVVLVASVFNRTAYKRRPTSLYGADDYVEQHHVHDRLPGKLRTLLGLPEYAGVDTTEAGKVTAQDTRADLSGAARVQALALNIVADIALYHHDDIASAAAGAVPAHLAVVLEEGRRLLAEMMATHAISGDPIAEAFLALLDDVRRVGR